MKDIFSIKVMVIMSALFTIMIIHRAPAAQQNFNNIDGWVTIFEDPERDEWQKPDEVVKSINLKSGDIIADIGAGTGYFTRRFAKTVGPGGQALGLDIRASRVEYMKEDARKLDLSNYKALIIKPDDPGLEPGSVDVVFLCNTYHHIENRVEYFKRLSRSLKKNGRVVIVDFYKKPLPVGPSSLDHKLAKEVVLEEFREAGYILMHDKDFLPYQYYLEFGL
jgi:ubiquinone/menaquinone biosynthesis C-methylase UbiE